MEPCVEIYELPRLGWSLERALEEMLKVYDGPHQNKPKIVKFKHGLSWISIRGVHQKNFVLKMLKGLEIDHS